MLLVRLTAYALAYVPGRVLGMSEQVQALTLGYRRGVAPWIGWAVVLALVLAARSSPRASEHAGAHRPGELSQSG
jgi:hypothetical protein